MQYVNDDMDELFRKAAENYPLDTKSADFNKMLAALQNRNGAQEIKSENKGRFLWLLLLLPLGLLCNKLYSPSNQIASKAVAKKENSTSGKPSSGLQKGNTTGIEENHKSVIAKPGIQQTEIQKQQSSVAFPSAHLKQASSGVSLEKRSKRVPGKTLENYTAQNSMIETEKGSIQSGYLTEPGLSFTKYISPVGFSGNRTFPEKELSPVKNPFGSTAISASGKKKGQFYAGLVGGFDATTVKFQKIENGGYSYGLLLGYQFNKKWSIESGVYWENKFYYSDGTHFNSSKLYLPPNTKIDEVSGDCKMIEIPINVKYQFASSQRSGWFGTLGTSSYFMKEEEYNYFYYYSGPGTYVNHYKNYKTSSDYLFSVVHLSAGYAHRIGKQADLRIEPYLKLPITGMGVGKLPLLSTGVHLGIVRKF